MLRKKIDPLRAIVNDIIPKAGTFIFTVMLIQSCKKFTHKFPILFLICVY